MNYLVSVAAWVGSARQGASCWGLPVASGRQPACTRGGPSWDRITRVAFPAGPVGPGNRRPLEPPRGRDWAGVRGPGPTSRPDLGPGGEDFRGSQSLRAPAVVGRGPGPHLGLWSAGKFLDPGKLLAGGPLSRGLPPPG